jgi:CubicO group peptidase (beta-lactamase class C family)
MRSYCSTSYCIAGRLIEVVTGRTFEQALAELLLRPLGIRRFAFYREDVARYRVAVGHRYDPESEGFRVVEHLRLPHAVAAAGGSLTMTATELLRFGLLHAYDGTLPGESSWIAPEYIRKLREPSRRVPPDDSELICAWLSVPVAHDRLLAANGATIEQNAFLVILPAARFALAILANTGGGADRLMLSLGAEILQECTGKTMLLPSPVPPGLALADADLDSMRVSELEGDYRNVARCNVRREGNRLRLHMETEDTVAGATIRQSATLVRTSRAHEFAVWLDDALAPHTLLSFLAPEGGPARHLSMASRLYVRV